MAGVAVWPSESGSSAHPLNPLRGSQRFCMLRQTMKHITSRENAHYKELVRLARSSRARREAETIVLDGVHLVRAYVERFASVPLRLFIKQSAQDHHEIAALSGSSSSVMLLDDILFDRATPVQSP